MAFRHRPALTATSLRGLLLLLLAAANGPARADLPPQFADRHVSWGLPPSELATEAADAPRRFLENDLLGNRGIETWGYVNVGIGANAWGSDFNGPIGFNDRNWMGQLNQLYLINERKADGAAGLDLGGRVDLLYGTDFFYTVASGLDASRSPADPLGLSLPRWNSNKYYGLAMPQLYAEAAWQDVVVWVGHFYTIVGYQAVPALSTFFYTRTYTCIYGEPLTQTGVLATWTPSDRLVVQAGITNGWDNFDDSIRTAGPVLNTDYPGWNSNAAFLGAVTLQDDGGAALTLAATSGNEGSQTEVAGVPFTLVGNLTSLTLVGTLPLSARLAYVGQGTVGWWDNAAVNAAGRPTTANWYGLNQNLFWSFTDRLVGGVRLEWFFDADGTRVISALRNQVFQQPSFAAGFQGGFCQMAWGLNWLPTRNLIVRPELRYDWYTPTDIAATRSGAAPLPFGRSFDRYGQFYGGCDAIWQF
jgi:hypothetical protein